MKSNFKYLIFFVALVLLFNNSYAEDTSGVIIGSDPSSISGVVINKTSGTGGGGSLSITNNTYLYNVTYNVTGPWLGNRSETFYFNDSLLNDTYVPYNGSTRDVNLDGRTLNVTTIIQNGAGTSITTTGGVFATTYGSQFADDLFQWVNPSTYWRIYNNWIGLDPMNITLNASDSWFNGLFNWAIDLNSVSYLIFNGSQLQFNESHLNQTILSLASGDTSGIVSNLSNETTARIGNDTVLGYNLSLERDARINNDTELRFNISERAGIGMCPYGYIVNGTNSTGVICVELVTIEQDPTFGPERTARIGNDTVLGNNLTNERSARINNDTELGFNISRLTNNLSEEKSARMGNDTELQINLSKRTLPGECPTGKVVNGTNTTGVMCITPVILNATYYYPYQVGIIYGTGSGGNTLSNITYYDSQTYNVTELVGANPLTLEVNFTGITSFQNLIIREKYSGANGHEIEVGIYDYVLGAYENYGIITDQGDFVVSNYPVFDYTDHLNGGHVNVRLTHLGNGLPNHKLYTDFIWLSQGPITQVNIEHDSLSGRDTISNHPWAFDTNGSRNVTFMNVLINITTNQIFGNGSGLFNINWTGLTGFITKYLFNNNGNLDINETMLNNTIKTTANIYNDSSALTGNISELSINNTAERNARINNDTILGLNLSLETSARLGNDTELSKNMSNLQNVNSSMFSNQTTWWANLTDIITKYLFKNGVNLDINESMLNNTIKSTANIYNDSSAITGNISEIGVNMTAERDARINNDTTKVAKTGDTMTGNLTVPSIFANTFWLNKSGNACMFFNGSNIIINNNASGFTCP